MRKFLPENGQIAWTNNRSHFGLPGPTTGLGQRSLGPATGLGKQPPSPASHLFCHHQCDDDLGPVTDKIDRVEGCAVTASSRGVREHPSTSNIPSTPALFGPGIYYDPSAPGLWHPSQWTHLTVVLTIELGRDSSTLGDGDRIRSKEPVMVGSLCIEDNGGDDDDDEDGDGHGHGDDDELVPVAHASSSGYRPVPEKGKGLTGSFMSVMSKIVGSR
ncbi:hypothetical protein M9H77_12308 [Catharanthus roseus]|uniref:Uncharacterized protein n=1 Tax=Catharanthus roseus TaxID=4058 RepID=A0ACC0BGZ3_CATRO|nr:hypothetical protein M9H77_12308 [Catharanthus roseus]